MMLESLELTGKQLENVPQLLNMAIDNMYSSGDYIIVMISNYSGW
jgi:hypothetical protein